MKKNKIIGLIAVVVLLLVIPTIIVLGSSNYIKNKTKNSNSDKQFSIYLESSNGGQVSSDLKEATNGTLITLSVEPEVGYFLQKMILFIK